MGPDRAGADDALARKLFAGPCDFVWGASGGTEGFPPQALPEVAFAGRSNAGKSSLINALTGRKTLARVSQVPGRTQKINFFDLGKKLMLVDLPGYGYAKTSRRLADEWQRLIFTYLSGRASLKRVLLLIDARRGVMDSDLAVMELLNGAAVSNGLVLTKADALKPQEGEAARAEAAKEAAKHTASLQEIHLTSSRTGQGVNGLRQSIAELI
jgi:GTP-binding protein